MENERNNYDLPVIRIAVVEDHTIVRQALVSMLGKDSRITVVFEAENGNDFLEKLKTNKIDIVLLDLDMPIMGGHETIVHLKKGYPDVKVIILSMHSDEQIAAELIQEGAASYLLKNCTFDEMLNAIVSVQKNGTYSNDFSKNIHLKSSDQSTAKSMLKLNLGISAREELILKLICDGKTSKTISERVCLSKKTIDAIRCELNRKLNANNTADLIRKSISFGLYSVRSDDEIAEEETHDKHLKTERKLSRSFWNHR